MVEPIANRSLEHANFAMGDEGGGKVHTLVIVPTYCEVGNIEPLVVGIFAALEHATALVIDDNSPDGTLAEARKLQERYGERLVVISRESKTGVGSALKVGFRYGIDHGFTHIVQMDGDMSHDPSALPALLKATETSDIVVGSRLLDRSLVSGRLPLRSLITRCASKAGRAIFKVGILDSSSGYKCWTRRAVELVAPWEMASNSYAFQMECNIAASRLSLIVSEIPIDFQERFSGRSKADGKEFVNSGRDVLALVRLKARLLSPRTKAGVQGKDSLGVDTRPTSHERP